MRYAVFRAVLFAGVLLSGGFGPPPRASDSEFLKGWKKVVLAGRKALLIRGKVSLTLSRTSYRPREGVEAVPRIPAVELRTETKYSFFGFRQAPTRTRSILEAATGRSLEFLNVKKGKSSKRMIFGERSYRQIKKLPPEGERTAPEERWVVHQDEERPYEFPDGEFLPAGIPVHDAYALLYLIGETALSGPDGPAEFIVVSRGKLLRVRVAGGRLRENERKVRDLSTGKVRRLRFQERELILTPVDQGSSRAGLFSMEGKVELWVEEETRTLLEVSGKIPGIPGRTVLRIQAVEPGRG